MNKCTECTHKDRLNFHHPCMSCEHRHFKILIEDHFEPAKPKVLTAEELIDSQDKFECRPDFINFAEKCHKNGRLEMYLEFEEFLENESDGMFQLPLKIVLQALRP